jgi:sulfatase maturation enzyme AslB (radical SAM superfamily)
MYSAIERLNELNIENNFIDRTKFGQYRQNTVPNWMKSNEQQIFESLKENFITALLRQESGAAISNSEFEKEERKYFPMP